MATGYEPYRSQLCDALNPIYMTSNRTPVDVPVLSANDVIEEDDDSGNEVDHMEILADAQVTKAVSATQNEASCKWASGSSKKCGISVSYNSVPEHFKNVHGIRKMNGTESIHCAWEHCNKCVQRKNFARHIRECHLGHSR